MNSPFLLGGLDTMSGVLDRGPSPCLSKQARRRDAVYIASDSSTIPRVFIHIFSPPKQRTRNIMPPISSNPRINSRRQSRTSLAGSPRRAPLQQALNPSQPAATTVDIPGTGGGKENMPPGMSIDTKDKTKPDIFMMSRMTHQLGPNTAPRKNMTIHAKGPRKEKECVTLGEAPGSLSSIPKKSVGDTLACDSQVCLSQRILSAIVIQRAWRSFAIRRIDHAQPIAISDAKTALACEAIARWWRTVKAHKLPDQVKPSAQIEQLKPTEQKSRKSARQRAPVRQNCGRRGIRRL